MNTYDTVIKGIIVTHKQVIPDGFIAISGETIALIGEGVPPPANHFYDESGSYIMPGGIDSQVHSRSQKDREGFSWSTRSAASGGVTTIIDMPYDEGSLISNAEHFKAKVSDLTSNARTDVALYATIDPEEKTSRIFELVKEGAVGFKFSTFGTDAKRFPRIPPPLLFECFKEISFHNLVAGVHNENEETVKYYMDEVNRSGITDWRAHVLSRPRISETLAMTEIYELAAEARCRGHVVHCSLGRGYEICSMYQRSGFNATIEACIHYLTLNQEDHAPVLKGLCKVNPPIRPLAEVNAIWNHLAKGNVTVVSTDHVSWSVDRKNNPEMLQNSSGLPGLEVLYPLLLTGCNRRGIPFETAAKVLARNPAILFNINNRKGTLEHGKDADISIFKKESYNYNPRKSGNNISDWSPYEDMEIDFKLSKTFLRGQLICDAGTVLAQKGFGTFIKPFSAGQT